MPRELDRSVTEEYELAHKEGRQPLCVYCGEPLEISQTQSEFIYWRWNKKQKKFLKLDTDGDADKPFCCACEARDWDFLDETIYTFF